VAPHHPRLHSDGRSDAANVDYCGVGIGIFGVLTGSESSDQLEWLMATANKLERSAAAVQYDGERFRVRQRENEENVWHRMCD
jgi:hypothetical protein